MLRFARVTSQRESVRVDTKVYAYRIELEHRISHPYEETYSYKSSYFGFRSFSPSRGKFSFSFSSPGTPIPLFAAVKAASVS